MTIKEKIKTLIKLIFEPKVVYSLISFRAFGYLLQTGWFHSFKWKESVDMDLKPIPWFTYSAIDFITERLKNNLNILEFGSGNSTMFFAERVNQVLSVEHNESYYNIILSKKPNNVEIKLVSSKTVKDYLQLLADFGKFDLIVIDGLYRNECIKASLIHLTEAGIIILDDSERDDYSEGIKYLLRKGFRQINFSGIAPGIFFRKCTTFFYKDINCLNI